jgi:SAM-dependent methyltransferase
MLPGGVKKHLYNARLSKVEWFVKRFGWKEVFFKPLRTVFAPLLIARLPEKTFRYKGQEISYLYHRYNMTWASERCVEVPIGRWWISQTDPQKALEVGNVLSHYEAVGHQVLDKFEKAPGVINEDILTFKPATRYQLILSISTFEHIGFDDEAEGSSADKILAAIEACRRLLAPDGKLVITIPVNYNPELDELIAQERLPSSARTFLHRTGYTDWQETDQATALRALYTKPYPYANAVMIAEFAARS